MSAQRTSRRLEVLLIEDDTLVGVGVKGMLTAMGHRLVGQAANAAEAQKLFTEEVPDLLLVDVQLGKDDGISVLESLLKQRTVPAIIISAYSDKDLIERASQTGVFGYLIKPVLQEPLRAQIEVAIRRFDEWKKLKHENISLVQTLEERKLIERAKGIYMRRFKIDEAEAHKRLQQDSQKRRLPLVDVAKRVIDSVEFLGEP